MIYIIKSHDPSDYKFKKLIYVLCFGEAPVPKRYEILRKSETIVISVVWATVWSQEANWSCDKFWFFGAGKVIWWAKGGIEGRCPATGAHSRRFLFSVVSEGRAVSQVAGKAPFTPAWLLCTLQGCSRMLNHCSCCPPKLHSWLLRSHVACRYKPGKHCLLMVWHSTDLWLIPAQLSFAQGAQWLV